MALFQCDYSSQVNKTFRLTKKSFTTNITMMNSVKNNTYYEQEFKVYCKWNLVRVHCKKKVCNAHQIWCAMFVPSGTPYMV